MAEEVIIELLARTEDANKKIEELTSTVDKLTKQQEKSQKATNKLIKGLKGMGLALKAIGIGVILKVFDAFSQALMRNQEAADLFRQATLAIQLLFKDLIELVVPLGDAIKRAFSDPKQAAIDLGNAIKDYVKNFIDQSIESFGHLGKAFKRLVNFDLAGAVVEFKNAGRDMTDAMVGVEEGGVEVIKEGLEKVTEYVEELPEKISKANKQAERLVELQKQSELAEIERQRLQLEFQRTEEQLRQLRDDERVSIDERLEANEKLLGLLQEQTEAERKVVQSRIDAARLQYQITGTQEDLIALKQAELELVDLVERIEGQRSEALTNRVSLEREALEIERSRKVTSEEVAAIEQKARIDMEENELTRLQMEQDFRVQEHLQRMDRINEEKLAMILAGQEETQAFQDLKNEEARIDAEFNAATLANADQTEKKKMEMKKKIVSDGLAAVGTLFGQESIAGKAASIAQATMNSYEAFTNALNTPLPAPFPQIAAASALASGLAAVRNIVQTPVPNKFPGGGATSGGGGSQPTTASPNVSIIGGNTPLTQATRTLREFGKRPTKAFVVSGDVTSNQALDRRIERNASIGG